MLARLKIVAIVCMLSVPEAHALTYGQAHALASSLPEGSFSEVDHGSLCEKIGVAKMEEMFPGAHVYNGIEYKDHARVIGELDLVIEQGGVATHVIEVKCWKNYSSAAHKADDQLERFARYAGRCDIDFSLHGDHIPCDLFGKPDIIFGKMSYSDAKSAGFDYSFDLSRNQVMTLIDSLLH